jgi:hypothetical protein
LSLLPINTSVTIASRICRFSVLLQKPHNNQKVDLCYIDKSKKYCQFSACVVTKLSAKLSATGGGF